MSDKKNSDDLFKNWVPEIIEYDASVDGSDEYVGRDELLKTKESLKEEIVKLKQKRRINKVRR